MTPSETIAPHGGTLVDLLLTGDEAAKASEESEHLPKVAIGRRELSDLEMLAVGALSPLTGFVGEKDYHSVLEDMHLSNGLVWTIPVTLSVDEEEAKRIGGAALDVFTTEPLPKESPLWTLENVIVTPHNSGSSPRAGERTLALFAENLRRYKSGETLINRVDYEAGY